MSLPKSVKNSRAVFLPGAPCPLPEKSIFIRVRPHWEMGTRRSGGCLLGRLEGRAENQNLNVSPVFLYWGGGEKKKRTKIVLRIEDETLREDPATKGCVLILKTKLGNGKESAES